MLRPRPSARRWVVVVAVAALWVAGSGCASEPPEPTTADLVAKLGILRTQQQFTAAQVQCVAEHAMARLHGDALRDFADELSVLQTQGSSSALSPSSLKVFTDSIAACAVAGR